MEEKRIYLSDTELFRDISARDLAELELVTTLTTVTRGRVFYRPEDPGERLFLLRQGRVQLYRISPPCASSSPCSPFSCTPSWT